jgi:CheY-like chemotaxis protein
VQASQDVVASHGRLSKPYHMETHDKPLILCVDDDAINHMVLENFFKPHGFAIEVAMSGFEAMSYLEQSCVLPDVVLMDVMMPGMSGLEVTAKIRELFPHENIPVILLSAMSSDDDIVMGLKSGSQDYITKPFSKPELLARVQLQLDLKVKANVSLDGILQRLPHVEMSLPPSVFARLKRGSERATDHNPNTIIMVHKLLGITELTSDDSHLALMMLHQFITLCDKLVDMHRLQRVENTGACFGWHVGRSV